MSGSVDCRIVELVAKAFVAFATPKKLVAYLGLNPVVRDSVKYQPITAASPTRGVDRGGSLSHRSRGWAFDRTVAHAAARMSPQLPPPESWGRELAHAHQATTTFDAACANGAQASERELSWWHRRITARHGDALARAAERAHVEDA